METFKIEYPAEPAVGTVVETPFGARFRHINDDPARPGLNPWIQLDANGDPQHGTVTYTWAHLLREHPDGLTDVTPLRTWELPPMPPVGTKMRGQDKHNGVPIDLEVMSDGTGTEPYLYTEAISMPWSEALTYGPLTEVR